MAHAAAAAAAAPHLVSPYQRDQGEGWERVGGRGQGGERGPAAGERQEGVERGEGERGERGEELGGWMGRLDV